jgi:FkbM family methyltransferase
MTTSASANMPGCSSAQLRSSLEEIFQEQLSSVMEREGAALDQLLTECGNRCVLFGAGSLGRQALAALREIGVAPLAIADNNPKRWGTMVEDIPLVSPADAAQRYGKDAVFFIAIRNEFHSYLETYAQLQSLGCTHISSVDPIAWRFPARLQPELFYGLPHKLYEQSDLVLTAAELWADDLSRAVYLDNIRLRALGDRSWFRKAAPEESYFLEDIFRVSPADVFVDCGAFDGDTIGGLLARQSDWAGIEAVEADPSNFAKLKAYVQTLDSTQQARIHLHECAIGAKHGMVQFEDSGLSGSTMKNEGGIAVKLMPIDGLFSSTPVSILKMDIEGSEIDGLIGARQVIARDKPILAVCAYHRQDDICTLPILMHDIDPEYRLYLRTHGGDGIQTVAYAVPPHRVIAA